MHTLPVIQSTLSQNVGKIIYQNITHNSERFYVRENHVKNQYSWNMPEHNIKVSDV